MPRADLDADALVAHLSKETMHPELRRVFRFFEQKFPGEPVAIIGSAVKDYDTAKDIDVLLPHSIDWQKAMKTLNSKYNGFETTQGHLRRANLSAVIPDVSKKVQVLQVASAPTADAHPNAALLADGTVLKAGKFFDKASATNNFKTK